MQTIAQIPETLFFDDEPLLMCTTPLEPWLAQRRIELRTERGSARCLRGYIGNWELHRGRLYLVALRPFGGRGCLHRLRDGGTSDLSMSSLFPGENGPVRADWFSGQLRCPLGQILKYQDVGYDNVYERDMLVDIDQGRVERIVFRHNDVEPMRVLAPGPHPAGVAGGLRLVQ